MDNTSFVSTYVYGNVFLTREEKAYIFFYINTTAKYTKRAERTGLDKKLITGTTDTRNN